MAKNSKSAAVEIERRPAGVLDEMIESPGSRKIGIPLPEKLPPSAPLSGAALRATLTPDQINIYDQIANNPPRPCPGCKSIEVNAALSKTVNDFCHGDFHIVVRHVKCVCGQSRWEKTVMLK